MLAFKIYPKLTIISMVFRTFNALNSLCGNGRFDIANLQIDLVNICNFIFLNSSDTRIIYINPN